MHAAQKLIATSGPDVVHFKRELCVLIRESQQATRHFPSTIGMCYIQLIPVTFNKRRSPSSS